MNYDLRHAHKLGGKFSLWVRVNELVLLMLIHVPVTCFLSAGWTTRNPSSNKSQSTIYSSDSSSSSTPLILGFWKKSTQGEYTPDPGLLEEEYTR